MKIALINENSQKKKNAFILEVLEKVGEIEELLEGMELENVSELEDMLEQFLEKLREEYYLEFLKRFKDLANGEEEITDAIEILEGILEDYQDVLDADLIEALEELIDDFSYLDEGDIHAKSELLNSFLEGLS